MDSKPYSKNIWESLLQPLLVKGCENGDWNIDLNITTSTGSSSVSARIFKRPRYSEVPSHQETSSDLLPKNVLDDFFFFQEDFLPKDKLSLIREIDLEQEKLEQRDRVFLKSLDPLNSD